MILSRFWYGILALMLGLAAFILFIAAQTYNHAGSRSRSESLSDDSWVWGNRIYRVVARPIEREAGGEPIGAIVGAKIVDDGFALAVTKKTGAAVGFFADNSRVASAAPEGFNKASLDEITRDLKN